MPATTSLYKKKLVADLIKNLELFERKSDEILMNYRISVSSHINEVIQLIKDDSTGVPLRHETVKRITDKILDIKPRNGKTKLKDIKDVNDILKELKTIVNG